jgi:hypothetical protein
MPQLHLTLGHTSFSRDTAPTVLYAGYDADAARAAREQALDAALHPVVELLAPPPGICMYPDPDRIEAAQKKAAAEAAAAAAAKAAEEAAAKAAEEAAAKAAAEASAKVAEETAEEAAAEVAAKKKAEKKADKPAP